MQDRRIYAQIPWHPLQHLSIDDADVFSTLFRDDETTKFEQASNTQTFCLQEQDEDGVTSGEASDTKL